MADPGRVHHEPSGLCVLDEGLVQPGLERVRVVDDRLGVVGDQHPEHPAEERPRRLATGDHGLSRLAVRQPHELVAGEARGEHQGVHDPHPTRRRVGNQAHLPEVQLALRTGLTIGDPDRRSLTAGAAAHLGDVALHRAQRADGPFPGEQLVDLHGRQVPLDPPRDPVVMGAHHPPRLSVAVGAVRADRLHHLPDHLVAQLGVTTPRRDAGHLGRCDVTADRLAVHPRQPLDPAQALTRGPQPKDLPDLEHANLPERHRRSPDPLTGTRRVDLSGHRRWWTRGWSHDWRWGGPITGAQVVPCHWRNYLTGGPMLLAGDTNPAPATKSPGQGPAAITGSTSCQRVVSGRMTRR